MDNKIVTHFMQLNAEWSFYGSLAFFRQELVILTDLKYLSLYIVGFSGRDNLLYSDAVIFKSAQKIFMCFVIGDQRRCRLEFEHSNRLVRTFPDIARSN